MLNCAKLFSIVFLVTLLITGCVPYSDLSEPALTRSNENYSSNTYVPADVKELGGTYIGFLPKRSISITLNDLNYDYSIKDTNDWSYSGSGSKGKFKYDTELGRIFIDKLNVTLKVESSHDAYKLVLIDASGLEIKDKIGENYTLFKVKNADFSDRTILRKSSTFPHGYSIPQRKDSVKKPSISFADFLKKISWIPELEYDTKPAEITFRYNYTYHASLNIRPGNKNFNEGNNQIIRLWAEFIWFNHKADRIVFRNYFDRQISYNEWLKFNFEYTKKSYESLWAYLNYLFSDGSAKFPEMEKVKPDDIQVGDIFMSDNYYEKAAIVIDVAEDKFSGRKIVVLAQGSKNIPGLHILLNSSNIFFEKWFETDRVIFTPEGTFNINDLRRFKYDK